MCSLEGARATKGSRDKEVECSAVLCSVVQCSVVLCSVV